MKTSHLLFAGLLVLGASILLRKKAVKQKEGDISGVLMFPPAGFRRARKYEITPAMVHRAFELRSEPVGTLTGPFTNESGAHYYITIEMHSGAKDLSLFIQKDQITA